MRYATSIVMLGWLVLALVGCADPAADCSSATLTSALAAAAPGSVVSVGACRMVGRFTVGAGVTLRGTGPGSVIASAGTAVELAGDGAAVEDLTIEHGSGHGIVAISTGSVAIRRVEVDGTLGRAGIGIDGPSSVVMEDVTVTGPVTRANATSVPALPTATDTVLFGIILDGVTDAQFTRVSASGFGKAGVVSRDTTLHWTGGDVGNNLGIGVWVDAGSATVTDVTIHDSLRGFRGGPTWGFIARGGANIDTNGLTVAGSQAGFGVAQEGGTATHSGLISEQHQYGAVLAQRTTSFSLTGASDIRDNEFAGVIAVEADGLIVEDTVVTTTTSAPVMLADWGSINVGDGIQVVRPTAGTTLRRITVDANARAGILFDLGGGDTTSLALTDVASTSTGTAYGCLAQNGTLLAGWDSGLVRSGAALVNDPAFSGLLDAVGIVGPSDMPAPADIAGIVGPSD
jgi:hypothetical protein